MSGEGRENARRGVTGASRKDGGLALITVLLITAILVALTVEFAYRIYIGAARAGNLRDSSRASLLATDGVVIGKSGLEKLLESRPNLVMGAEGLKFTQDLGDGLSIEITVLDEYSKASLRTVYTATGLSNEKIEGVYSRLLEILGLDYRLSEPLADWVDADDDPRPYGAEAREYSSLKNPHGVRNGYVEAAGELRLIKGYSREVMRKIEPFVSPYNTDGLININTAPKEVLLALDESMTDTLAEAVIEYRDATPFKDKSDILKARGLSTIGYAMQDKITVESRVYRIRSRARAGDAVKEAEAVVKTGGGILFWSES